MMEYRKSSFLAEIAPDAYGFFRRLKPYALIYFCVLVVVGLLSIFFHNVVIKFFVDCMMGWTLFSVGFICTVIVVIDKEIKLPHVKQWEPQPDKPKTYQLSKIWGIFLIVAGIITLYYSNQYKNFYAFTCEEFYLDQSTGKYHIENKCKYIGVDENGNKISDVKLEKVKGADLVNTDYDYCDACREWVEDAEMYY